MRPDNPFKPTFGVAPPVLVGRDEPLERLRVAMSVGPSHPDSTMLISSPRGLGKTVLLGAMHDIARESGWVVAHVTASPRATFAGLLTDKMIRARRARRDKLSRRRVETASAGVLGFNVGLGFSDEQASEPLPRLEMFTAMEALAETAEASGSGVLVTIDEFHNANVDGAREFAHNLQELSKLGSRPILFVAAGLPVMEDTVLADSGMTFFQRIARTPIGPLTELETRLAIAEPIRDIGVRIDPYALTEASEATSGYPFMVQLVGYHSWECARDLANGIDHNDTRIGIDMANHSMELQVLRPVWRDLSDGDQEILAAMSLLEGPEVRQRDIADISGKKPNNVSVYVSRLVDAGVLTRLPKGRTTFVHEAMRRWVSSHQQHLIRSPALSEVNSKKLLREQITDAHHRHPNATHKAIADLVGAHPSYVGRVRREL